MSTLDNEQQFIAGYAAIEIVKSATPLDVNEAVNLYQRTLADIVSVNSKVFNGECKSLYTAEDIDHMQLEDVKALKRTLAQLLSHCDKRIIKN